MSERLSQDYIGNILKRTKRNNNLFNKLFFADRNKFNAFVDKIIKKYTISEEDGFARLDGSVLIVEALKHFLISQSPIFYEPDYNESWDPKKYIFDNHFISYSVLDLYEDSLYIKVATQEEITTHYSILLNNLNSIIDVLYTEKLSNEQLQSLHSTVNNMLLECYEELRNRGL